MEQKYLGDGLYAIWNGYQMELRANDLEDPTDVVYLERNVMESLLDMWESINNTEDDE